LKLSLSAVLSLALFAFIGAGTASAGVLYDNGFNGNVSAWGFDGTTIANSFTINTSTVLGINFEVWAFPGETMTSVDWAITSDPLGGTTYASGTSTPTPTPLGSNVYLLNLIMETIDVSVPLSTGNYWLQLGNATMNNGDPVYWDQSDGPSTAIHADLGPLAAYGVDNALPCKDDFNGSATCSYSESFQLTGNPEPASFILLGTGLTGMAVFLRRRKKLSGVPVKD
jgi:hypothetical protein